MSASDHLTRTKPGRNRLANEASPYLQQHAANPVDWYPWGEEAFARARAEDKPIFLSVGYSTCHWCHVMAHESFEDPAIAEILNRDFINIKVDREERPDVDRVYMAFVQATTGSGGWPMSVWLTPDLQPFYGGTYFPPEDRWGRPGFASLLQALARVWRDDRERVQQQAAHAIEVLRQFAGQASGGGGIRLDETPLKRGYESLRESFDERWGGFGAAPKFPRPAQLQFLWRVQAEADRRGEVEMARHARHMARHTLERMAAGGLHDHLGGGFHRYSVDGYWHVPHFEKMLYDQAQLGLALLDGWQVTGSEGLAAAARDTLAYVQRDLTAPGGGFYSAEDADSLPSLDAPKRLEGAFYVWTKAELETALGPEAFRLFALRYGIEEGGNAPREGDPHGELAGKNVLAVRRSLAEVAKASGVDPAVVGEMLAKSHAALLVVRARRPRPHRDEKIVTAWNGLMISAFARAARVFDDPGMHLPGARAARLIRQRLWRAEDGVLHRSWSDQRLGPEGFAEDYAFLIQGLLDLYESTFQIDWLRWALELQEAQDHWFWDAGNGGYFSSSGRDPSVLLRMKEDHDGAEPAPSSVAAANLLRLGRMLGDERLEERARATLQAFGSVWANSPQALPAMLSALADALRPPRQVVLAGRPGERGFERLAHEVRRRYLPALVVLAADGSDGQAWLAERAPHVRDMRPVGEAAAAYVCENFACQRPVTDPEELARRLDGQPPE